MMVVTFIKLRYYDAIPILIHNLETLRVILPSLTNIINQSTKIILHKNSIGQYV